MSQMTLPTTILQTSVHTYLIPEYNHHHTVYIVCKGPLQIAIIAISSSTVWP